MTKITLKELELLVENKHYPKILTPTGFEQITNTYRKIGEGKLIQFDDKTELRCSDYHLMMIDGEWKTANTQNVGNVIENKNIVNITNLPEQEWVDFTINAEHESYFHNGILHHNSGKSFIIYLIIRFLLEHTDGKILISVPSTNLVRQMHVDFCDYENDSVICEQCYEMAAGVSKETEKRVVIATWSMLLRRDPEFFEQFKVFICDECVHPDSMVTMSDGSQKPIKEIKEGDWVKSLNETTHQIEDKVVEKVHTNLHTPNLEKRFKISLENGTDLIVTGNHKVMTKRGWVEVKLLTEDDEILTNVG